MFLGMFIVGCLFSNALNAENEESQQQAKKEPKVFDNEGTGVYIDGNDVLLWMENGDQTEVNPHFEKTVIVKLKKDGSYNTQFQLRSIKKALEIEEHKRTPKETNDVHHWKKFVYAAKANNGIECPRLINIPDRDKNNQEITFVVYKTESPSHCAAYLAFLKEQEEKKIRNRVIHGQC